MRAYEVRSTSLEHIHRLDAIREYMDVKAKVNDPDFETEVIVASKRKLENNYNNSAMVDNGEHFISNIASNLNIAFEEIRTPEDVTYLQNKYLKQNELGFGQLELELQVPNVDALLFKRQHKPNHYVAVLNLQDTEARVYWNKAHEVSHRLIEPPQKELFHRHRTNQKNRVEHIVDLVAAEIAYYTPLFRPIVDRYVNKPLTWDVVEEIQKSFSPTSSLIAVTKAIIKHWPAPVFLIESKLRGRKNNNLQDQALRAAVTDRNVSANNSNIFFFPNMRVPESSSIHYSFMTASRQDAIENLSNWVTSRGDKLLSRKTFTSARPYGQQGTLALISLV